MNFNFQVHDEEGYMYIGYSDLEVRGKAVIKEAPEDSKAVSQIKFVMKVKEIKAKVSYKNTKINSEKFQFVELEVDQFQVIPEPADTFNYWVTSHYSDREKPKWIELSTEQLVNWITEDLQRQVKELQAYL